MVVAFLVEVQQGCGRHAAPDERLGLAPTASTHALMDGAEDVVLHGGWWLCGW